MTKELASRAGLATIGKAHVFVSSLEKPELSDEDRHHLERVLRLGPNETVTASDGFGRWRCCWLRSGDLRPMDQVIEAVPARQPIGIAVALLKGDRTEWVVQKLAELGVDRITLLETGRSVVKWSQDRQDRQLERMRKVAREAAMQSRQAYLPIVEGPVKLGALADEPGIALADHEGGALTAETAVLVIGPEGGWTPAERVIFKHRVTLGSFNLRSETAALFGASLLVATRTRLVAWA